MFQSGSPTTTLLDASLEIGVILLGTFILGMMMWWILKPRNPIIEDVLEEIGEVKPSYAWEKKVEKKNLILPTLWQQDDFKIIQGITPKLEKFLRENNIQTFDDIVREDVAWLEAILLKWAWSFQKISPITWPDQARLAAHWKWTELEEYQEILAMSEK
jgi:predicted flap endonuclease-1-like 5' DNA nuclease